MFTGIIQELGTIKSISSKADLTTIEIEAKDAVKDMKVGDSISVEGICSTVTDMNSNTFSIEFMPETMEKTCANKWQTGSKLNLEPAMKLSDKLNGHFVSGHVDTSGEIINIKEGEKTKDIDISFPPEFLKFIALKGSIAVDGISLTISLLKENYFTVSLIPHTIENTTLGKKKVHDKVNLEVDMISRYLKQLFDERDKQTSYEFLKDRGFI